MGYFMASPKDGRTYQVINVSGVSASILRTRFNQLKDFLPKNDGGVIQDSASSVRKSLDNSKIILKFRSASVVSQIETRFPARVLFTGTLQDMTDYLSANSVDWDSVEGI